MEEKIENKPKKQAKYRPLWRSIGASQDQLDSEGYAYAERDRVGAQTEAGRELLNFSRDKLPQRTYLNEKQVNTFAMMMTEMAALDEDDPRPLPEVFMESIMTLNLSLKGRAQNIGMYIFQNAADEETLREDGFKAPV
jgi:hypothetical protein